MRLVIIIFFIIILFSLSIVVADVKSFAQEESHIEEPNVLSEFIKPLLPGDIIFCKGVVGAAVSPMFDAVVFHDHLSVFLGKKEEFAGYLRKDQREKYLDNWQLRKYNPFNQLEEDTVIVYDVYPDPLPCGTNARFLDIRSIFFQNASAQRFPVSLSYGQREKIIQFLFDNIDIGFDHKGISDENDNLWTCVEVCESAYKNAGVSFFEFMGLNHKFISAVEMPFLCKKGNAIMRQILAFFIIDFATIEISNNFQNAHTITYYSVRLTKDYGNGKIVQISRIQHDKKIVDVFAKFFGFKEEIEGPFLTEAQAMDYISISWDENYSKYILGIKSK
jgi:hypothetical protein